MTVCGTLWKRFISRIGRTLFPADAYLREVSGVIHVGANAGQERTLYERFHLNVAWIEPIPSVFEQLRANLVGFPKQRAYQYLLSDRDDQEYVLHIASNEGASSSILPLAKHRAMWPEIYYTNEIRLKSTTLDSFVAKEALDLSGLQALVLDTQGSELMILKGAAVALPQFRFVKVEVPDFESYEGCCLSSELTDFMTSHGFRERRRDAFNSIPGVGTYFDVLYKRVEDGR
jgi:FkbM family methyltransferase